MKLSKPSKVENCVCERVQEFGSVKSKAEKMYKLMGENYGLAAPQVGIMQRFFIMKNFRGEGYLLVINPVIEWTSEKIGTHVEGCLTYPGETYKVKRPKQCRVSFQDGNGMKRTIKLSSREAQIFQHEYDHLEGITIKIK